MNVGHQRIYRTSVFVQSTFSHRNSQSHKCTRHFPKERRPGPDRSDLYKEWQGAPTAVILLMMSSTSFDHQGDRRKYSDTLTPRFNSPWRMMTDSPQGSETQYRRESSSTLRVRKPLSVVGKSSRISLRVMGNRSQRLKVRSYQVGKDLLVHKSNLSWRRVVKIKPSTWSVYRVRVEGVSSKVDTLDAPEVDEGQLPVIGPRTQ